MATINRSIQEALGWDDPGLEKVNRRTLPAETSAVSDADARATTALRRLSAELEIADRLERSAPAARLLVGALGWSDAAPRSAQLARLAVEALACLDQPQRQSDIRRTVAALCGLADGFTRRVEWSVFVSDTIGPTDARLARTLAARSLSVWLTLPDAAQNASTVIRMPADVISVADLSAHDATLVRLLSESLAAAEAMLTRRIAGNVLPGDTELASAGPAGVTAQSRGPGRIVPASTGPGRSSVRPKSSDD